MEDGHELYTCPCSTFPIAGQLLQANAEITFYGAEDPFFVTYAPGADDEPYLSEDLRVFSSQPGQPVPGV